MTKKSLILLLALSTTLHLSGCSSGGSKEEGDVAQANDQQFSEEGEGDFAQQSDIAQQQSDGQTQVDGQQQGTDIADQGVPQDTGQDLDLQGQQGQKTEVADAGGGQSGQQELVLDDPQPLPEDVASSDPAATPTDPAAPAEPALGSEPAVAASEPAAPPTDEPLFKNDPPPPTEVATSEPTAPAAEEAPAAAPAAPKPLTPLLKVKESAFSKNGVNLNRVYVARPGDNLKSVAKRLFGDDAGKSKQNDLKAWNPVLKRGVKTGDKIYYPSTTNPEDTRMLTYYEDHSIQPQVYTTKDGDNIRKLSKQFLGASDSWKEVWATNLGVDSKGDLPAGVELKYWPQEAADQALASTSKPAGGGGELVDPGMTPPMPPGMGNTTADVPPPPPPDMNVPPPTTVATNDVPPPPPVPGPASTPDSMGMGTTAPPPPDANVPPPPPPEPPKPIKPPVKAQAEVASSDPDTMMAMGLGGILIMAAAVLFVVLRKNRARKVDLGQTQV